MSVVGLDFGSVNSVVALARRKGIDVVLNTESKRETPAMVNFGDKQRFIGCAAADKINMKPKNTIVQLKRLIGLRFSDPEVQALVPAFLFPISGGPNDEILITVDYLGEKKTFTPERLVAMILSDLKGIAEADHGAKVTDSVISVPVFFTDAQRRAMLDAASIAGLNVMRLMHETTATALAYGIFKTAEFGDDPHNVVFVDVGASSMQVCVVRFTKAQLKVLATGFDRNLGGSSFDQAMMDHFCEEFKATKKIDIKSNARASLRLRTAVEKMKKILSANPEAPLSIECIMDDVDVNSKMTREKMEELSSALLDRMMEPVKKAMSEAGMIPADVKAVELVGNASRMPFISSQLEAFFGMPCSRTLNASECVARGCALQGAMLSPQFRVRDFEVVDSFPFPVSFSWQADGGEVKDMELFERNNAVPSSKMMTFFRNETFTLQAKYTTPTLLPPNAMTQIGSFDVGPIPSTNSDDGKTKLKVKVRLNLNGLVSVESAQAVEEIEEEVAPAPAPAPATPMPATLTPVPHLTIVFVGLDGAGKTAVIRALADDGQRRKSAASTVDPDEGALCAPPTTVAVTIHAGLRACGVSIDVVDVPGGGIVAGNARHVAWRRHLDALKVTPAPKESAPREIAKRTTTMTEPVVEVDCVVFVVDSADDLRMAVARDELWRLCGLVPPGDDASGWIRTLDRAAPANTLADSTAMLVLANKSDVSGALAAGEVADALDLDQLRAELGAVGVRVMGCEACSAVDGGGIERALEGALRRER
mmetsp:Transcript_3841/g.15622  ORF Transcript_3841/g.15622 Transcript_3841/m.15622 type:complete len:764 (-) Transcript_3841:53-2344(-)